MLEKIFMGMKKNKFNYSDLSNKELENLKEYYVNEKVKNMNELELRKFVYENISHQIKNTIGDEEEQEAWDEIESFFSDDFELILKDIKKKFESSNQGSRIEPSKNESSTYEKETKEVKDERVDMWMD